ncbi:retrovirus-related pol polyprotein from transposon TNT 1-94 [Tanacetum coccineum]
MNMYPSQVSPPRTPGSNEYVPLAAVLKQTTRTLVVTLAAKRTLVLIYNKSERTLFSETKPNVHLYGGCGGMVVGRGWQRQVESYVRKNCDVCEMGEISPSNSHSPQPYYVNYPSFVIDYDDDYQGEIQGVAQEDKLSTAMMVLARAITQHYSTPTNNRLRTSSNTRNQAVIQDGRVDIKSKNVGYAGNGKRNARRKNRNQATNARNGLVQKIEEYDQNVQRVPRTESTLRKTNVQCYKYNGKGHYARECPKPRVGDAKYFREQMLLAAKDEAVLEELNALVIMMARIQPTDDKSNAELISEINASQIDMINGLLSKSDHEHKNHEKLKTVIHTYVDDQIDSNIIFKDPYTDNNNGQVERDLNAYDQPYADIESLIYNVQVEAESQRQMIIELKKQKALLQREFEMCKGRENIEKLKVEKEEIRGCFLKASDKSLNIKNEPESFKKAFKVKEDKYLDDIVILENKLKSHERVVFKMSHSLQTIHILGTKPNSFYDLNMKAGLEYENSERLKKAIEAQLRFPISKTLNKCSSALKQEITEEVQDMLEIFKSMESKVDDHLQQHEIFQIEIDRLLEASLEREVGDCVMIAVEQQKN